MAPGDVVGRWGQGAPGHAGRNGAGVLSSKGRAGLTLTVLLGAAAGASAQEVTQGMACRTPSSAARLDHVVIVVADLEAARSTFRDTLGFALKPGRVHENGLENVHIRFSDGSALELMTTGAGKPDGMSEWYARFLARGEGGAFVALRAGPTDSVLGRLGELAAEAEVVEGRAFDWVSFPVGHPLHSVFFVHVRLRPPDEPAHLQHRNGAEGLGEVWLEAANPQGLGEVLARFGALPCGEIEGATGTIGQGYGLAGGSLVAVPTDPTRGEGRILTVVLDGNPGTPPVLTAGVRLRWRAAVP